MEKNSIWTIQAPNGTIYRTNQLRRFMFAHPEWFAKPATQYVTAYNFLQKKEPGKRLCTFAGGWVVLSNTSRHDDMAQSIHWWSIKSPDGKEHLVIGERYRHFLQTCGYFEVGSEPYYCFKCGLKKASEEGTPVTLKNGWVIARPVPLEEFRLVDIVGPEMEQEYIYDANGNSHPKRLSDVRNYKRGQIEWTIADPDGRIYHTKSLFNFLRERKDFSENPRSAVAMLSQIIAIRCGLRNGKKLTLKNGWTALDRSDVHDLIEQRKQNCQESATNTPIERKHRDLTGQRFGMLTALYRLDGKGKAKWRCRCDCGIERDVLSDTLIRGHRTSCGCRGSKDLTNQRFGSLIALYRITGNGKAKWHCRCDCGDEKDVFGEDLLRGNTTSCGFCKYDDLTGQRFGALTVLSRVEGEERTMWHCRCDCGNEKDILAGNLRSGLVTSCGCGRNRIAARTESLAVTPQASFNDIAGKRFGMLTAIRYDRQKRRWLCRCDCGGECYLNCAELKTRRDCGCSAAQAAAERIKAGANGNRLGTNINTITNIMSGKLRKTNTSGITGVSIKGNCYRARIVVRGREINLGKFTTLEAAVRARKEAENKYFAPLIEQDKENQKE